MQEQPAQSRRDTELSFGGGWNCWLPGPPQWLVCPASPKLDEGKDCIVHGLVAKHMVEAAGLGHHLWRFRPQALGAMLPTLDTGEVPSIPVHSCLLTKLP